MQVQCTAEKEGRKLLGFRLVAVLVRSNTQLSWLTTIRFDSLLWAGHLWCLVWVGYSMGSMLVSGSKKEKEKLLHLG